VARTIAVASRRSMPWAKSVWYKRTRWGDSGGWNRGGERRVVGAGDVGWCDGQGVIFPFQSGKGRW
jgi:hypothetical protein